MKKFKEKMKQLMEEFGVRPGRSSLDDDMDNMRGFVDMVTNDTTYESTENKIKWLQNIVNIANNAIMILKSRKSKDN